MCRGVSRTAHPESQGLCHQNRACRQCIGFRSSCLQVVVNLGPKVRHPFRFMPITQCSDLPFCRRPHLPQAPRQSFRAPLLTKKDTHVLKIGEPGDGGAEDGEALHEGFQGGDGEAFTLGSHEESVKGSQVLGGVFDGSEEKGFGVGVPKLGQKGAAPDEDGNGRVRIPF